MLNNNKTVATQKQKELKSLSNDVRPIVEQRMNMLNNINYYTNIRQFYREYIFVTVVIFLACLVFANKWSTVTFVMIIVAMVYIIIWIINYIVAKVNTTKHIPEIIKEHFDINQNTPIYIDQYDCVCQAPSIDNPFMNVLVSDWDDNPFRPKACNPTDPAIEKRINDFFYSNPAFINPHDIYQTHNDQHQWYTQPATTIPYDREGWMNDAYRNMTSCKSDQYACANNLWDLRRP